MKAKSLISARTVVGAGVFIETVLWLVPQPLKGSRHTYKYRLALVSNGVCVLRYDNEAGKGDHRHVGDQQFAYHFSDVDALLADFRSDVRKWLHENGHIQHPDV
jgi:hypothetical protein